MVQYSKFHANVTTTKIFNQWNSYLPKFHEIGNENSIEFHRLETNQVLIDLTLSLEYGPQL